MKKRIAVVRFLLIFTPAFVGALIVYANIHSRVSVYETGTRQFIKLVDEKANLHESGNKVLSAYQVSQMLKKSADRDIEKNLIEYLSRLLYIIVALSLLLSLWLAWALSLGKQKDRNQ